MKAGLKITESFVEHMFRCLDCRACETACPSGVHFGAMMEEMRGKIVDEQSAHWLSRLILNHISLIPGDFRSHHACCSFIGYPAFRAIA